MIAIPKKVNVKKLLQLPQATVYEFGSEGKIRFKRKVDYHLAYNGEPPVFEFFLETNKKSDEGKSLEVPVSDIIELLKLKKFI